MFLWQQEILGGVVLKESGRFVLSRTSYFKTLEAFRLLHFTFYAQHSTIMAV
jgi:hypothetical protein